MQTLRQLLRPAGEGLMCPALGIRDWPNADKPAGQQDLSREALPQSLLRLRAPGA
jgi:hypothetical protein